MLNPMSALGPGRVETMGGFAFLVRLPSAIPKGRLLWLRCGSESGAWL
jgi:hypothetical protein